MKHIKVFAGKSIQHRCKAQRHPVAEVENVREIISSIVKNSNGSDENVFYSNSTDFIMAMKYIGLKHGIKVEFFLDGVSSGNSIEPLFEDFNKSLDMINEFGATEE
jgi:hypothetical protein